MSSITLKSVMDKKPSELSDSEAIMFSQYLFDYLKFDNVYDDYSEQKRTVKLSNGRTIQHVNYLVMSHINKQDMGFQDELVYIGRDTRSGKKSFMGVNWNKDMNSRVEIVKLLTDSDLKRIALSVMASKFTNKKNRN